MYKRQATEDAEGNIEYWYCGGCDKDYSESDFYEMEIGTAGLMRNYMARKCDIHFPLERTICTISFNSASS